MARMHPRGAAHLALNLLQRECFARIGNKAGRPKVGWDEVNILAALAS